MAGPQIHIVYHGLTPMFYVIYERNYVKVKEPVHCEIELCGWPGVWQWALVWTRASVDFSPSKFTHDLNGVDLFLG